MKRPNFPNRVDRTVERARQSGALVPISTDVTRISDGGVDFLVWIVAEIAQKEEATEKQRASDAPADPFAPPYEEELFVEELSETHVCLLNKFNVMERHLLVVTREYVEQTAPLDLADFRALWACLGRMDGLGFYNGGRVAGASQTHKHLQLVGYPLGPGVRRPPMEALFEDALPAPGEFAMSSALPFEHSLTALEPADTPADAARATLEAYERMVDAHDLRGDGRLAPYNLLVTREWMLLVPRSRERFDGMSVNALGFAGSLLVRDDAELERLREAGPMQILDVVATQGPDALAT